MKKSTAEVEKQDGPTVARFLLPITVLLIGIGGTPARGNIIYSDVQNITLRGVPDTLLNFSISIARVPEPWDVLSFGIDTLGVGGATNDVSAAAEVALASSSGDFPLITRFQFGDPYPSNPVFGSGSETLWGFGTGAADGDFFAAMMLGTFGTGPEYTGWVHLNVSNSSGSSPTLAVIDWAYSDQVGQTVTMGQGRNSVPEIDPSSGMSALALLSGALLVVRGRRSRSI